MLLRPFPQEDADLAKVVNQNERNMCDNEMAQSFSLQLKDMRVFVVWLISAVAGWPCGRLNHTTYYPISPATSKPGNGL